ncbi:hypothetical protein P170DRAFT_143680 [Aspergillus steynii IBT 23096]|uniref:Life-span regulatory factor-domain-containing protein n=1 Tax=Aspergillus steynii IBT 23096 TaxID=1392250 RepID=A0A2I2GC29_9EURO|nr:uncharacterized protein P170DRAFT_143680 [Aspergillus steynii IBT 23096]PLB50431.1 hypothetical protein P170DRAFT_143680 [Aspergillus steynii IBT 23096]
MTQGHYHPHHRRTLSGSNVPKVRSARPALHRKGTSFVNHSIAKLGSGNPRRCESDDDRQPEMAASFLNFCAMCERQITVPDNSLLYCSESCRRKDSHKPLSASFSSNSSMPSSSTPPTSPPMSPRIIVAPMTPTKAPMSTPAIRIPGEFNDSKTDQDPSEWKPVIPMSASGAEPLASSDAWHYLSQFHGGEAPLMRRPKANRNSSSSLSTLMSSSGPIPSLAHTPSTVASSVSSNASDYLSYVPESAFRPLPPRHNPSFSSSACATKGVELVVPHVEIQADDAPVDDTSGSIFPANSSLWDDVPSEKAPLATAAIAITANGVSTGPRASA